MISKTNIKRNIRQLKNQFNNTTSPRMKLFYSKLALIELCGWIEESMDDVVEKCCNRVLKEPSNKEIVTENFIPDTHGFKYKTHFRPMLIYVVGLVNVERLEKKADPVKMSQLKSTLGGLVSPRNNAAHTHIRGTARSIDAPSTTENNFHLVYEGLKNLETELRKLTI